jgi:hypothetical protein
MSELTTAGEYLWRKQILSFGKITYGHREVDLTPGYLGNLADAFSRKALDLVPFLRMAAGSYASNDPELCLGAVRALEMTADGMDALVAMGREGDDLIGADVNLPVAAGIIEDFIASDGRQFPAVLRHVVTTGKPILTGLHPWRRA